jgi:hypothetical protein
MTEQQTRPATRIERLQALAWLDALADQAKEHAQRIRVELETEANAEYVASGMAPTWRSDVATVSARVSNPAVFVANPGQLVEWMIERHPDRVTVTPVPDESFVRALMKRCRPSGDVVVDPRTGDTVPGLGYRTGGRFLGIGVKPTDEARQVFSALAVEALYGAALTAQPVIGAELAAITAAETTGHLDPGEVDA